MSEQVEEHILKRFELVKKVGSGAYGHVWKAINRRTKATVALKKIFDAFQHSTDAQRTFRQITLLNDLNHPNIVRLHTVIRAQNDKDIYLVFEYMETDLHNVISQRILQDIHIRFVMYQMAKAIKYLHSAQLIHRDLKPSNILVNSDCNIKICDFGLVRCLAADKAGDCVVLTEEVATRWYRAPEVLLGSKSYDKSADIWSLGCILAQMLLFKPMFPGNSTLNQLERILSYTGRPSNEDINSLDSQLAKTMIDSVKNLKVKSLKEWFNASIPNDAIDLISRMLDFNPHRRPTAVEILQHPYLSQFHNINEETVSPSIIRPPISDNKKLSLKEYRNLLYEQIKRVYNRDSTISTPSGGSILTPTPGTVNRTASDMLSPKRVSEKEPITREQSHHKYSQSFLSSSKKKDSKIMAPTKSGDYQAQIRSLLEEQAVRLHKKSSGFLHRRKDDLLQQPYHMSGESNTHTRHSSPMYSPKMRNYPVIQVDKENKRHS